MKSLWVSLSVIIISILFMNDSICGQPYGNGPDASTVTPVIFIPGHGASRIMAKLDRTEVIAPHCPKKSDWFTLWFDVWEMANAIFFGSMDCFVDNLRTVFDPSTRTMKNVPGVYTKIDGFGSTETLEFLGNSWLTKTLGFLQYVYPLFNNMSSRGYIKDKSLLAAPYDYRFLPHSQPEYMDNLKLLIEDTFKANGDRKVSLLAHSIGGFYGLYFLNKQTQDWKDKHIHSFSTMGTPWKGAAPMALAIASGWNFGVSLVDPQLFRRAQKTHEVAIHGLPRWKNHVYAQTPTKNYTEADNEQFLEENSFEGSDIIYHRTNEEDYQLIHPGVHFFCFISNSVPTPETYIYSSNFDTNPQPAEFIMGDGDGTVSYASLRGCNEMWAKDKFEIYDIKNVLHNGVFSDSGVHELLFSILQRDY